MIGGVTTTSRPQQRYDHRRRDLVLCENPAEADLISRPCPVETVAGSFASGISAQYSGARWPISHPLNGARH